MCPSRTASASACSSMMPPRATLISRAPFFIRASSAAPITPRVLSLRGTWTLRKSDCASRVSKSTSSAPACSARSAVTRGSSAMTRILRPWEAILATSNPILPSPSSPSVFPRSSVPTNAFRSHRPSCIEASAREMLRASAIIIPTVCSAAAMVLPVGALSTSTPCRVAASRSMLSTPTPARPTTLRRRAASSTSAVTLVSLRTTSASTSAIRRFSSSGERPVATSTSPAARSRSTPSAAIGSETRMRTVGGMTVRPPAAPGVAATDISGLPRARRWPPSRGPPPGRRAPSGPPG